jgi:hypothetical protein
MGWSSSFLKKKKKGSWVRVLLRLTEIMNRSSEDGFNDKRV